MRCVLPFVGRGLNTTPATSFYQQLRTGNGSTATVTPGFAPNSPGSLVITKAINSAQSNVWTDTVRGASTVVLTPGNTAQATASHVTAFGSSTLTLGNYYNSNQNTINYLDLVFHRTPGFLDIVAGNDTNSPVSHNLGVTPGLILLKDMTTSQIWGAWHRGNGSTARTGFGPNANSASLAASGANVNSSTFDPELYGNAGGSLLGISGSAVRYYVFAHNPAGNVQCGQYTGNGSASGPVVNLGWQPTFVLIKALATSSAWVYTSAALGWTTHVSLSSTAAQTTLTLLTAQPTGFQLAATTSLVNTDGAEYLYMAIR